MVEQKIHGLLSNCLDSGLIGPLSNSAQVPLCKSPVSFEVRVMPLARWLRGRPSSGVGLFCSYGFEVLCVPDDHFGFSMILFCDRASGIFMDISLRYSKSRHLHSACIFCSLLNSGTVTKIQVATRDGGKRICV